MRVNLKQSQTRVGKLCYHAGVFCCSLSANYVTMQVCSVVVCAVRVIAESEMIQEFLAASDVDQVSCR